MTSCDSMNVSPHSVWWTTATLSIHMVNVTPNSLQICKTLSRQCGQCLRPDCPVGKRGWPPPIWMRPPVTCLHLIQFVGYSLECIGPDFARTFVPIWPAVRYVWRGSLRVLAVRLWDMLSLGTDGTGWLWIVWTCRLPQIKATGIF